MVGELPLVGEPGALSQLSAASGEPLGGEDVEGWDLPAVLFDLRLARRLPDPELHRRHDAVQFCGRGLPGPTVGGCAEGHVLAVAVGGEPQGEDPPALRLAFEHGARAGSGHQRPTSTSPPNLSSAADGATTLAPCVSSARWVP